MEQKLQKVNLNHRIDYIKGAVQAASSLGLDSLVFETNLVRGCDEGKVVFVIENNEIDFPFAGLGISRLDVFKQRLQLFESVTNVTVEAMLTPETKEVMLLQMKAPGISVEFRCATCIGEKAVLKSPRAMKEQPKFEFELSEETINLLVKGHQAFGGDTITLLGDADGVHFKVLDKTNDEFLQTVSPTFTNKATGKKNDGEFNHPFLTKTLLNVLRNATDGRFGLNERGILRGNACGLGTYIVRKM